MHRGKTEWGLVSVVGIFFPPCCDYYTLYIGHKKQKWIGYKWSEKTHTKHKIFRGCKFKLKLGERWKGIQGERVERKQSKVDMG